MPERADMPEEGEVRPLPVPVTIPEARPVEVQPAPLVRSRLADLPAPVIAAAGGFMVGMATWVLVRLIRRDRRAPVGLRARTRPQRRGAGAPPTPSLLVDVHLLKR